MVAPPSAHPAAATVDAYYGLDASASAFRPGQRVAVSMPLADRGESLVLPWSAVVYDVHGGTWVYERVEPRTFVRRRVQVRHVVTALAVLQTPRSPGAFPQPGDQVVVRGVAELFGTEFGVGK